jgi:UDP-N-acetylglucosamine--N-acetylmuramyl-(pentapeptide) pyrophosphoryl-undecaprenol N-acetylglucosamine transferase
LSGNEKKVLVFTGGGTAGHVWPHFAIAGSRQFALCPNLNIHYLGSAKGMEKSIVENNAPHWTYHAIHTGKLRRYFSWQNFKDVLGVFRGFFDSLFALRNIKPNAVFSKGGFVSAPVVWAAWCLRIPVFIHESDATPALATQLCLPFCKQAFVSFSETVAHIPKFFRSKVKVTGLPLRRELFEASRTEALKFFEFNATKPVLLVFGGSLGAEALNKAVGLAIPDLVVTHQIVHIVGKGKSFEVKLPEHLQGHYSQKEFLTGEMSLVYAMTDIALCRAGASSIFELKEAGIPMLLVPLGLHQSRGDQIVNAKIFTDAGLAEWKQESMLTPAVLCDWVHAAQANLAQRKERINSAPRTSASEAIAKELLDV